MGSPCWANILSETGFISHSSLSMFNPFPNDNSSRLKHFAEDNYKFDTNGIKLFKQVENSVGKGEIAVNEQFLLFYSFFKRLLLQTCEKQGLFGKGLNNGLLFKQPLALEKYCAEKPLKATKA